MPPGCSEVGETHTHESWTESAVTRRVRRPNGVRREITPVRVLCNLGELERSLVNDGMTALAQQFGRHWRRPLVPHDEVAARIRGRAGGHGQKGKDSQEITRH